MTARLVSRSSGKHEDRRTVQEETSTGQNGDQGESSKVLEESAPACLNVGLTVSDARKPGRDLPWGLRLQRPWGGALARRGEVSSRRGKREEW